MSRGITLIAVGNKGYLDWAFSMAASIKFYSPEVKIQLITSRALAEASKFYAFFDITTVVDDSEFTEGGKLFPAKLKLSLYKHLYFEETIYLDVDGCLIKDITPVFETKADLAGDIQGVYDRGQGDRFDGLKWAHPDVIWEHYQLPDDARLPAINSSFMFIRKTEQNQKLFEKAYENLMNNPIPVDKHWHQWVRPRGNKIGQPDELYFDVAMAQMGIVPEHNIVVYFRTIKDGGPYLSIDDVRSRHYAIGLFGDLRTNHLSVREMYDRHMPPVWREVTKNEYCPKSHTLGASKFVTAA